VFVDSLHDPLSIYTHRTVLSWMPRSVLLDVVKDGKDKDTDDTDNRHAHGHGVREHDCVEDPHQGCDDPD